MKSLAASLTLVWMYLTPMVLSAQYVLEKSYCEPREALDGQNWECASIHTVLFYSGSKERGKKQDSPIIPIRGVATLEFDELADDANDFSVALIHCNMDWTPSQFQPIEYMVGYPEQPITDYEFSMATKVLYVHYTIEIPKVKLSGNYLVRVFLTDEPEQTVLTRRMVAYQNRANISVTQERVLGTEDAFRRQQLNVDVGYQGIPVENPRTDVTLVLRQNQRWDNVISLKPLFARPLQSQLDFKYFDLSNTFLAGNEYRAFETTSFQVNTLNVASKRIEEDINTVYLYHDQPRAGISYDNTFLDANGRYGPYHQETGGGSVEADYAWVEFTLRAKRPLSSDVYVIGGMTDYRKEERYKMRYIAEESIYRARVLLKQGYYNYLYATDGPSGWDLAQTENNHFMTGNTYEALVYYTPFGGRGDEVIGYVMIGN